MFVTCRKAVRFTADNGTKWEMRPGFIGDVPQWVEEHPYFEKLCKDGTITAIVSKKDRDIRKATEKVPNKKKGTTPPVKEPETPAESETPTSEGEELK